MVSNALPKRMTMMEPFVLVKAFPAISVQNLSAIPITTRPYILPVERIISRLYLIFGSVIRSEDSCTCAGPSMMTYEGK